MRNYELKELIAALVLFSCCITFLFWVVQYKGKSPTERRQQRTETPKNNLKVAPSLILSTL